MRHAPAHLTLLVPGLAGPPSDPPITDYFRTRPLELDRLLSRSRLQPGVIGLDGSLCRSFGLQAETALPVAALCWLADCDLALPANLLRADPVHLRADQSCLRLYESHSVPLSTEEAGQLVDTINGYIATRGWHLSAPHPQRWYLELPHPPALVTHPPAEVAGADIDAFLPAGADARQWHAVMNEIQMLMHDHPVNSARSERGEPVINSLWFWGNGALPDRLSAPAGTLYADHPLARGLATHAGSRCLPLPASLADWAEGRSGTVVLDALEYPQRYNDVDDWLDRFDRLEENWLRPAALALRSGRMSSLTLDSCNGHRWLTSHWRQLAFWKPQLHFEAQLTT